MGWRTIFNGVNLPTVPGLKTLTAPIVAQTALAALACTAVFLYPPCADIVTMCTAPVIACGLWHFGTGLMGEDGDQGVPAVYKFALTSSAVTVMAATECAVLWFRGTQVDLLSHILLGYAFWTWAGLEIWRRIRIDEATSRFCVRSDIAIGFAIMLWVVSMSTSACHRFLAVIFSEWARYFLLLRAESPSYSLYYTLPLATVPLVMIG